MRKGYQIRQNFHPILSGFLTEYEAQVAELVDALVSNTNGLGRAGSIPALGTKIPASLTISGDFF